MANYRMPRIPGVRYPPPLPPPIYGDIPEDVGVPEPSYDVAQAYEDQLRTGPPPVPGWRKFLAAGIGALGGVTQGTPGAVNPMLTQAAQQNITGEGGWRSGLDLLGKAAEEERRRNEGILRSKQAEESLAATKEYRQQMAEDRKAALEDRARQAESAGLAKREAMPYDETFELPPPAGFKAPPPAAGAEPPLATGGRTQALAGLAAGQVPPSPMPAPEGYMDVPGLRYSGRQIAPTFETKMIQSGRMYRDENGNLVPTPLQVQREKPEKEDKNQDVYAAYAERNGLDAAKLTPSQKQDARDEAANPAIRAEHAWLKANPGKTAADWEREKASWQKPPQQLMLVPGEGGALTAQTVRPGTTVGPGAMTPAGASSLAVPTSSTRTMAEAAPKVIQFADTISTLIDQQEKSLGPLRSRWAEFMAGKVGAPNPEFTKLRTDVGLLTTLLMRMHVGARGGEYIMQHFQDLINTSRQSPENLRAALGEIRAYAAEVQKAGAVGVGVESQTVKAAPPVGTVKGGYRFKGGDPAKRESWEAVQ